MCSRASHFLIALNGLPLASQKCRHPLSSSPVFGVSTHCLSLNNILLGKYRIHSICQVREILFELRGDLNRGVPFWLSDPATSLPPPSDYYERVSKTHEHGGYGSTGYRAPWSDAESRKLLLRTHTTASSAAMLWKLAAKCRGEGEDNPVNEQAAHPGSSKGVAKEGDDGFRPAKLFSIDRVFRNETMDATHLAEFHQVEGVVADRGLTLADLIGELIAHCMSDIRSRKC